eukprot:scaffold207_cov409-Prasinococcus_capsulatus_cf.AAC.119
MRMRRYGHFVNLISCPCGRETVSGVEDACAAVVLFPARAHASISPAPTPVARAALVPTS